MAVVVMLIGTAFYALVIGAISNAFASVALSTQQPDPEPRRTRCSRRLGRCRPKSESSRPAWNAWSGS